MPKANGSKWFWLLGGGWWAMGVSVSVFSIIYKGFVKLDKEFANGQLMKRRSDMIIIFF